MIGQRNLTAGFLTMGFFMAYGFLLIYLRDFAPDKEAWIAEYGIGKHFEARLAHVHGNLFAFLNIVIGYLLWQFRSRIPRANIISWFALVGLLMPIGILAEIYMSASPFFVLLGAISIVISVFWLGISFMRMKPVHEAV